MNALESDAIEVLTPVAVYGLGMLFPMIPPAVWSTIFAALRSGDLDAAALDAFIAEHNLKIYSADTDFPSAPPQVQTSNNLGET